MIRNIIHILLVSLLSAVATSCSKAEFSMLSGEGTLIVSGIISDQDTATPLKDITVTYKAYSSKGRLLETKTAYSSGEGIYTVETQGYTSEINCILTASDAQGSYSESQIELNIDWNGPSFNEETNTFVVNNCNFYLKKGAK